MGIDLRLMRYVVAVAEEGGFQRAAERLMMAQPPLSRQIRNVERELGVTLFHRRPVVGLTEAGRVFVESARGILADTDRMLDQTVSVGRGELGTVRVGYVHSAVFDTVPELVAAMARSHPGVTVDVQEGWSPALDAALAAGECDLILSRDIPERHDYRRELLRAERLVAVVCETHPLADRGEVALREFAGQRFCHPARRLAPGRHDFMTKALARTGERFEYWESAVHGLGHLDLSDKRSFALVPASVAGRGPIGTVTVAIADDLPTMDLQLVWRRHNDSAALAVLIATARELAGRRGWC